MQAKQERCSCLLYTSKKVGGVSTGEFTYNIGEGQTFRIPLATVDGSVPIFAPVAERIGEAGSEMKFHVSATSESGNALTYSASDLPRGASFDPETRMFTWIPDSAQIGKHHATFKAADGPIETAMTVNITVYGGTSGNQGGSATRPDDPVTPPEDKTEKAETDFAATPDQEVNVENKLANVTFPAESFETTGKGKLIVEKKGGDVTIKATVDDGCHHLPIIKVIWWNCIQRAVVWKIFLVR